MDRLARAITRCGRIFADFIVCTADRDSGPTLLARQIIPADFAVTNYLGRKAVYSNRYTVSVGICKRVIPSIPITITNSNGPLRSFCLRWIDNRFLSDFSIFSFFLFFLFFFSFVSLSYFFTYQTFDKAMRSLSSSLPPCTIYQHVSCPRGLHFILFVINKVKSDADYLHRKVQWKIISLCSIQRKL